MEYSDFLIKARAKHGDKYSYPVWETPVLTKDSIRIVCPKHGEFSQNLNEHVNGGRGCRHCGYEKIRQDRLFTWEQFVIKANARHKQWYVYPDQIFEGTLRKVTIVCPEHGLFSQHAGAHLKGSGCPVCADVSRIKTRSRSLEEFVATARQKHGETYQYTRLVPETRKVEIICAEHGAFQQEKRSHLKGAGCKKCAMQKQREAQRYDYAQTVAGVRAAHGDKYQILTVEADFKNFQEKLSLYCSEVWADGNHHGVFLATPNNLSRGKGCPACGHSISKPEAQVREFIESLGFMTTRAREKELPGLGRQELDIFIPELGLAVEVNGVIWHSEKFGKGRRYHLEKTELAARLGCKLIHIFEDDWLYKRPIVEERLRRICGVPQQKFHARQTQVVELSKGAAESFLKDTHLQGLGPLPSISLGLRKDGMLVAAATFGPARFGNTGWELLRFSSVGQVVGGASKLLAYFRKHHAKPGDPLTTFADRCWGDGQVYDKLGFVFEYNTPPGYTYTKGTERFSRQRFQKHKLPDVLPVFDPALTEVENCRINGYHRVFDCGHAKWSMTL